RKGRSPSPSRPLFDRVGNSNFRSEPQNDVESSGKLADARPFKRSEIHDNGVALLRVFDSLQDTVAVVKRLPLDVALSRPLLAALHLEGEMDVPCAALIKNRLDRAEVVFA